MAEEDIKSIEILKVVATANLDTGEKKYAWKFGPNVNNYAMLGLLDQIKHSLLCRMQEGINMGEE